MHSAQFSSLQDISIIQPAPQVSKCFTPLILQQIANKWSFMNEWHIILFLVTFNVVEQSQNIMFPFQHKYAFMYRSTIWTVAMILGYSLINMFISRNCVLLLHLKPTHYRRLHLLKTQLRNMKVGETWPWKWMQELCLLTLEEDAVAPCPDSGEDDDVPPPDYRDDVIVPLHGRRCCAFCFDLIT